MIPAGEGTSRGWRFRLSFGRILDVLRTSAWSARRSGSQIAITVLMRDFQIRRRDQRRLRGDTQSAEDDEYEKRLTITGKVGDAKFTDKALTSTEDNRARSANQFVKVAAMHFIAPSVMLWS